MSNVSRVSRSIDRLPQASTMREFVPKTDLESIDTDIAIDIIRDMSAQASAGSLNLKSERESMIYKAHALIAALETPFEHVSRLVWSEPAGATATQVAADLGIFDELSKLNSIQSISTWELGEKCTADPALVRRIMKHLAARHVVKEVGPDAYAPTRLARGLADRRAQGGIRSVRALGGRVLLDLPQFLADTGYKNPVGTSVGPFQYTHNLPPGEDAYTWLKQRPHIGKQFMNYMSGHHIGAPFWIDDGFYPVHERLRSCKLFDESAVLLVDMGGGQGHDLQAFCARHRHLPGRTVLQDLPPTIEQAQGLGLDPRIEMMTHDFFTPQPIKGARAYFMHNVPHNWDDEHCQTIFRHVKDAMTPGYSKLLLFENALPDVGASWKMTSLDWIMMANCGTMERTATQWESLLKSVGLRIEGIWTTDPTTESLIEVVVDE